MLQAYFDFCADNKLLMDALIGVGIGLWIASSLDRIVNAINKRG